MEDVSLKDILIVATAADEILLCIKPGESGNKNPNCLKIDLANGEFYIDGFQNFIKYGVFDNVTSDEVTQKYYRGWIYRKFPDNSILDGLIKFLS